jgi:hypothetical protein
MIAIESGAFVVSEPRLIPSPAFADDFPVPLPPAHETVDLGERSE